MTGPALTEADAAADLAGTPRPDFGLQPHEQRVITPTVGRKVWFRPGGYIPEGMSVFPGGQPLDATVVYVWHDRMVNLLVVDHAGKQHAMTSVHLVQPGDSACPSSYAEWMPYQVKQAGAA